MNTNNSYVSTFLVTLTIILSLATSTLAQSVDFRRLEQSREPEQRTRNLIDRRHVIWEKQAGDLIAEITMMRGELIWVSATGRNLHLSRGNNASLYPGDLQQRIPGRIMAVDVDPMPHLSDVILISVQYLRGNRLQTQLIKYNGSTGQWTNFYHEDLAALRPLGPFLYGQAHELSESWSSKIYRMKTTPNEYQWDSVHPFPEKSRLLQMTHVYKNIYVSIDAEGDLIIHRDDVVYDRVEGPFGTSTRAFPNWSPREQKKRETVRIPPVRLDNKNLIAVANNPALNDGLLRFISRNEQSGIELYRWNNERQSLEKRFELTNLDGRILDLIVTEVNPDQLLWLRKNSNGVVKLELLDFGEIRP